MPQEARHRPSRTAKPVICGCRGHDLARRSSASNRSRPQSSPPASGDGASAGPFFVTERGRSSRREGGAHDRGVSHLARGRGPQEGPPSAPQPATPAFGVGCAWPVRVTTAEP